MVTITEFATLLLGKQSTNLKKINIGHITLQMRAQHDIIQRSVTNSDLLFTNRLNKEKNVVIFQNCFILEKTFASYYFCDIINSRVPFHVTSKPPFYIATLFFFYYLVYINFQKCKKRLSCVFTENISLFIDTTIKKKKRKIRQLRNKNDSCDLKK